MASDATAGRGWILALHGGAGGTTAAGLGADGERACRAALAAALAVGRAAWERDAPALDIAMDTVAALEDCGRFNAGRGAVVAADGSVLLDAALMDGATRRAGAVAALAGVRNPIRAARLVLERSPHVLLAGDGARRFASAGGAEPAEPGWFTNALAGSEAAGHGTAGAADHGTVGAVARDRQGRLAAATSTGGTSGKLPGRVGDSPLIGAGTYADHACAVSATGIGEHFIRAVFAHQVAALCRWRGLDLGLAARTALADVVALGGQGGCIALDADGRLAMPLSTAGMPRACCDQTGRVEVAIDAG